MPGKMGLFKKVTISFYKKDKIGMKKRLELNFSIPLLLHGFHSFLRLNLFKTVA